MNPSRSLMGLALSLLLCASAHAQAQKVDWSAVDYHGPQALYIPSDALKSLAPGASSDLYTQKDKQKKAASHLEKGRDGKLYVVRGSTRMLVSSVGSAERTGTAQSGVAGARQDAGAGRGSQGVSGSRQPTEEELTRAADQYFKKVMDEASANAWTDVLDRLKAEEADPERRRRVAAAIRASSQGGKVEHADVVAALSAAGEDAGGAPQSRTATAEPQRGAMKAVGGARGADAVDPGDAISVIKGALTGNETARKDIIDTIVSYFLRSGPDAFVDPKYLEGPDARTRLSAALAGQLSKMVSENRTESVADLYFTIGIDAVPAWGKGKKVIEDMALPSAHHHKELDAGLKGWTLAVGKAELVGAAVKPGAYAGEPVKLADWALALLDDAQGKAGAPAVAWNILHGPNKMGTIKSINDNNEGGDGVPTVPGGSRANAAGADGVVSGSFAETYLAGGIVRDVVFGKETHKVVMKMITTRDPSSQKIVNEVGVYDITSQCDGARSPKNGCVPNGSEASGIYGRRFALADQKDVSAPIRPGGYPYSLSIETKDGKRSISMGTGKPPQFQTTQEDLLAARQRYVEQNAPVRVINGETYRVLAQPGQYTNYAYFSADRTGRLQNPTKADLVAYVGDKDENNFLKRLEPPATAIGFIGSGDKKQFYYLVWDEKAKAMVAQACTDIKTTADGNEDGHAKCGFPPPPAAPAPAATAGAGTTTPPAAGGTGTAPTTAGPTTPTTPGQKPTGQGTGPTDGVKTSFSSDCEVAAGVMKLGNGDPLYRKEDAPWVFDLNPVSAGANGFYLCMNGARKQMIRGDGIPVWRKTRVEGDNLVIETVKGEQVPPEFEDKGHVEGASFVAEGLPKPANLSEYHVHYIATSKLNPTANPEGGQITLSEKEWVDFVADAAKANVVRDVRVPLNDVGTDSAKVREAVAKALGMGVVANAAFSKKNDEAAYKRILEFAGAEVGRHEGHDLPFIDGGANITIHMFLPEERKDGTVATPPVTIVKMQVRGEKKTTPAGSPYVKPFLDYDSLIYCFQATKLETCGEHRKAGHTAPCG